MDALPPPLAFLVLLFAGWVNIAALVVRMATENPTWGYTRIRGGLKCVGHDVGRNTIKAILKDHGIEPAPERGAKTSWKTFLAAHWEGLAAADFILPSLTFEIVLDLRPCRLPYVDDSAALHNVVRQISAPHRARPDRRVARPR
jgi:hypothetical protein